jgi:hypothetical protein
MDGRLAACLARMGANARKMGASARIATAGAGAVGAFRRLAMRLPWRNPLSSWSVGHRFARGPALALLQQPSRRPSPMPILIKGLLLIVALTSVACAPLQSPGGPEPGPRPARDLARGEGADVTAEGDGSPTWRPAGELVGVDARETAVDDSGLDYRLDGADALYARLAGRCAQAPVERRGEAFVRELVADLYADGVDPGAAAEVMIVEGCGEPTVIVRELVAQGGASAAPLVVDRAISVQGEVSAADLEQAAADGLARWRRATGLEAGQGSMPLAGAGMSYSMVYFPLGSGGGDSGSAGARSERSSSAAPLFGAAVPGYGIYTFILHGGAGAGAEPANVDTYQELLRVIETYVLAAEGGSGAGRQAHTFLLPVYGDDGGGALSERTGPELWARMRGDFAAYLRSGGQVELAQRLSRASGPFLVSSLEPQLVPTDPLAPRMLVDLSDIGPEYMYSVVDAYDRLIPAEQVGSVAALAAIRARLLGMFPDSAIDAAAAPPPAGVWVYLFGRRETSGLDVSPREATRVAAAEPEGRGSYAAVLR